MDWVFEQKKERERDKAKGNGLWDVGMCDYCVQFVVSRKDNERRR